MSVRETIVRNTGFNALGRVWEALVGLVLIAYIVSQIGFAQYGLWGVIAAFTGYAALFDLGVCLETESRADEAVQVYRQYIQVVRSQNASAAARAQERIDALGGR